ncbi:MAG: RHS repeat protein [Acidobacteria bacterium]|nr:RHS repeat protein [Acidobacteriota bacterium]MBI3422053.1 RHS repeat protein [Acidobacteriota bacterium]
MRIADRNGNYIDIYYQNGVGPKISYIWDTLGRMICFNYDDTGKLVTLSVPAYDGQSGRLQVARFYYEALTINPSFTGSVLPAPPSTRQMLKYIYLNGTQTGWQFDYSSYGMIYRTKQLRGMAVSGEDLTVTGSVTNIGQVAATTEYNYPTTPSNLSAVPKYTQRTDTWAGQTTAPMVYQFAIDTANDKTTITAPDGTTTETTKYSYNGCLAGCIPGFIKQVTVKQGATTLATTLYEYEQPTGSNGDDRIKKITFTNEAGKVRVTEFEIYDSFNNVKKLVERGYDGNIIRRIETNYETGSGWLNRWLLRLPSTVAIYDQRGVLSAYTKYYYDNQDVGVSGQLLLPRSNAYGYDDVLYHCHTYDPYGAMEYFYYDYCPDYCFNWGVPYDPATDYRGNLTKVERYPVPTAPSNPPPNDLNTTKFKYDIAGNVVEESASCCKLREYTYIKANEYTWPTEIKRGNAGQLTTQIDYDRNTGLVRRASDESNQYTNYDYHPFNLRLLSVVRPDGGETTYDYQDGLFNDPDAAHQHSFVSTRVWREGGIYTERTQFYEGRGNLARSLGHYYYDWGLGQTYWSVTDYEYDLMGRLLAVSNPHYGTASDPSLIPRTPSNSPDQWTRYAYDYLGRSLGVQTQDGTATSIDYTIASSDPGMVETVTDQAGKQRRRTLDALGRVLEVQEPVYSSGSLTSPTPGAPLQQPLSTTYEYDGLNNVIKLTQGTQTRYFKYDGLGRLTHERHVEQDAPHSASDPLTNNSYWSKKIVYNTDGLVMDVWDACNIQTHFTYDGLNRVKDATYTGGTVATPKVTYNYDQVAAGYYNNGRLTEVITDAVSTTGQRSEAETQVIVPLTKQKYDYDRMGHVQHQQQTVGTVTAAINYAYNQAGQLTTLTYPSARAVQNQYEAGDGLERVDDYDHAYVGDIRYTAHGALQQQQAGNGLLQQRTYNNRLQVSRIELLDEKNSSWQRYDYLYGKTDMSTGAVNPNLNNGQLARVEGFINGVKKQQTRYEYDGLGRLSRAAEYRGDNGNLVWRDHYQHDRYGNRWQSSSENTGRPYVDVYQSDYDQATNRFVTPTWQYDAAGNLTVDPTFGEQSHVYDAKGRAVSTTPLATQQVVSSAVYDGLGQCVQTTEGSVTRRQVYDATGMVLAEYENGVLKRECIYGNGELVATVEPASVNVVCYMLNDQQGSRVVTDDNELVKTWHDYFPLGEDIWLAVGVVSSHTHGLVA